MARATLRTTDVLAAIPKVRAFGIAMCGTPDEADNLLEKAVRELVMRTSSQPSGPVTVLLTAKWLHLYRLANQHTYRPKQIAKVITLRRVHRGPTPMAPIEALLCLAAFNREALVLVSMCRFSYKVAAIICECPIDTIKSRVHRARRHFAELTQPGEQCEIDRLHQG